MFSDELQIFVHHVCLNQIVFHQPQQNAQNHDALNQQPQQLAFNHLASFYNPSLETAVKEPIAMTFQ